jgi:hypothetical protein
MSWIDKIQDPLIITTGDGKEYTMNWLNPNKKKDYNIAEFDFPNLPGTLVNRGMPMGRKFDLELYIQGENHLDTAAAFERSADDRRPWVVAHPLYGNLTVQPTAINIDNSAYNVSKITTTVIETITEDSPKTTVPPEDQIILIKDEISEDLELVVTATPSAADVDTMTATTQENFSNGVKIIQLSDEFENYNNAYNEALSAVNNAIASPVLAMRALNTMLTEPAKFTLSVKIRVDLLITTFNTLRGTIENIISLSGKQFFQNQATSVISSMCLSVATPLENDFKNSVSALELIDKLLENYDLLIEDLDDLQTDNGGNTTSFIPDATIMSQLGLIMNYTISNLYNIALNSRKERSIIAEYDTNIILLTHRLYALDPSDANMSELIENNGWGLNHILQIKKGTRVVYYI